MKLDVLNREKTLRYIAEELQCIPLHGAIRSAFICEHLRAEIAVHSESEVGKKATKRKVIRLVVQKVKSLFDVCDSFSSFEEEIRFELDKLLLIGELLSEGEFLLFSPTRIVDTGGEKLILLGAGPLQWFPDDLKENIQVIGRTRFISRLALEKKLHGVPLQRITDWLCLFEHGPEPWIQGINRMAMRELVAPDDCIDVEQLRNGRIYSEGKLIVTDGLSLIRYRLDKVNPRKQYALASLMTNTKGNVFASRVFHLNSDDARRIRRSSLVNERTPELLFSRDENSFQFVLFFPFPKTEARVLALAVETSPVTNSAMATCYRFAIALYPVLEKVAISLGVTLKEVEPEQIRI